MPTIIGTSEMPPSRLASPNVKRGNPAGLPTPTDAIKRPIRSETKPLSGFSEAMKIAQVMPRSTSQKYSKDENLSATSANAGALVTSTAVPNRPPTAENTRPAPSATSASPFLVIA